MKLETVKNAAPRFGLNESQLYRVIRENKFPVPNAVVRFGKSIRIAFDVVEESIRSQQQAERQAA